MDSKGQPLSRAAQKLLEKVQRATRNLPESTLEIDGFGHRTFRVGKKSFAILGEHDGHGSLSVKTDLATQDALIRRGHYTRTAYIGQHGWVTLNDQDPPDWAEVEELIVEAYRRAAPKRLLRQLDDE